MESVNWQWNLWPMHNDLGWVILMFQDVLYGGGELKLAGLKGKLDTNCVPCAWVTCARHNGFRVQLGCNTLQPLILVARPINVESQVTEVLEIGKRGCRDLVQQGWLVL